MPGAGRAATRVPVEVVAAPGEAERRAILDILVAHNDAAVGPTERRDLAILARDDAGAIVGGLWGVSSYRWLFVQYLALTPATQGRGQGRALMAAAEDEARARGCGGIWLDTFSFQARGFYERLGFAAFGRIDDFPPGEQRFFMSKRLR